MELRGFDSYEITLGDEMRGERASLGKSLEDAARDLRIKARLLVAIETCDLEGFPNKGVIPGYVRSYARYLGMDAEDCYQRFCRESGFQSPATLVLGDASGRMQQATVRGFGVELARSRFAAPPMRNRFQARVSLGALTSTAALVVLIAGLGYGGYALLQDIQRVGFAPIPEAPTVMAEAPLMSVAEADQSISLPDASDYQGGGIFAAVAMPVQLQPIEELRRDGPISAIDPQTAGLFVPEVERTAVAPGPEPIDSADDAIRLANLAETGEAATRAEPTGPAERASAANVATTLSGVTLHAAEDAWIRVRARESVIFEGILAAGQHYQLPARVEAPVLKAGNAGGVFVFVDGVAYGPLGQRGQIVREVSLLADDVRKSMPQAAPDSLQSVLATVVHQRAEAPSAIPRP